MIASTLLIAASLGRWPPDPWYPRFHVRPHINWNNDPCAPFFYNGTYHLLFIYNPNGTTIPSHNAVWGHAVSADLVFWRLLPTALSPDQPFDGHAIYTGSATLVDGAPVLQYSIDGNSLVNLAYPRDVGDPDLVEWDQVGHAFPINNPVIRRPPDRNGFRDPSTAWQLANGTWQMVVGCYGGPCLFSSADFRVWTYANCSLVDFIDERMGECPDFFALPGSELHVLKVSAKGGDWWSTGKYDRASGVWTPGSAPLFTNVSNRYDTAFFYASKSFFDPQRQRQVLFGWHQEGNRPADFNGSALVWASLLSLPREIRPHPDDPTALVTVPLPELAALRDGPPVTANFSLAGGQHRIVPLGTAAAELLVNVSLFAGQPTSLSITLLGQKIGFIREADGHTTMYAPPATYRLGGSSDGRSAWRASGGDSATLQLHIFVDQSVVEVFADGGRAVATARAYPTNTTIAQQLTVTSDVLVDVSVEAYAMKEAML